MAPSRGGTCFAPHQKTAPAPKSGVMMPEALPGIGLLLFKFSTVNISVNISVQRGVFPTHKTVTPIIFLTLARFESKTETQNKTSQIGIMGLASNVFSDVWLGPNAEDRRLSQSSPSLSSSRSSPSLCSSPELSHPAGSMSSTCVCRRLGVWADRKPEGQTQRGRPVMADML